MDDQSKTCKVKASSRELGGASLVQKFILFINAT